MSRDFENWNNEPATSNPRSVDRMPIEVYERFMEAERRIRARRRERLESLIVAGITIAVVAFLVYAAFG